MALLKYRKGFSSKLYELAAAQYHLVMYFRDLNCHVRRGGRGELDFLYNFGFSQTSFWLKPKFLQCNKITKYHRAAASCCKATIWYKFFTSCLWQNTIKAPNRYDVQESDPPRRTGYNDDDQGFCVRTIETIMSKTPTITLPRNIYFKKNNFTPCLK